MPTGVYVRTKEHREKLSKTLMGHAVALETKAKISKNHARQWLNKQNEEAANWKGENVGYGALHDWIRKVKGSPLACENCPKTGGNTHNYHWANLSGKYIRDLNDFIRLCVSCHKLFDLGKISIRGHKKI